MMVNALPSPNIDDRPEGAPIDTLILHYTGMRSAAEAIQRLRDPAPPTGIRVSSHYVVDEDGTVLQLVPDHRRAWHAGVSSWRGRDTLNNHSIGVEIVNPGHEWGYRPFPPVQVDAVLRLGLGLVARHSIPARNVVAHSDVAPHRKQDPGELFPWRYLAEAGLGLWPSPDAPRAPGTLPDRLVRLGYRVEDDDALPVVLRAFQRHWRPEAVTGEADAETEARLDGLLHRIGAGDA